MSIIIEGIKMPKEGNYSARLNVCRDGTALLFLYGECGGHEAKELPPHGRLIDADALIRKAEDVISYDDKDDEDGWGYSEEMILNEPTIIEAEVKE